MTRRVDTKPWDRRRSVRRSRLESGREELPTILIVCEGKKTEPNYFSGFRVPSVNLVVVPAASVHISVVRRAINELEKDPDFDEVWCVFDRDKNPKNSKDTQNFNRAMQLAEDRGFKVAYSNDAFELWYLLHFIYFDNKISRKDYIVKLTEQMGEPYEKNDPEIFAKLESRMDDAIKRAKRLMKNHTGIAPVDADPSTTVYELVEKLNKYAR